MTFKNNRAPLLCYFKLCAAFHRHWWIQTEVRVRKRPIWVKFRHFLEPCDLEIWRMTFKNNRAPLLSIIKLYACYCHMWIQTGVRVRKRLSWVLTSVTLTFDLWPWPFAWTSLLTMVITPENFMMIRWWEHGEKGVTDRRTDSWTDRRTENTICRAAWSQLKNQHIKTRHDNVVTWDIFHCFANSTITVDIEVFIIAICGATSNDKGGITLHHWLLVFLVTV